MIICPYSTHQKNGLREYKTCNLTHEMCPFIRICPTQNTCVHTEKAAGCELRLKEERKK